MDIQIQNRQIQKRNGSIVPFDLTKIYNAILRACIEAEDDMTESDLVYVTQKVCESALESEIPTVEQIQDLVEQRLIRCGFAPTAKAYIIYRAEHAKIRNSESSLMDIYKKLTYSDAASENIKRENANIDGDTAMGTMLKYGSEGSKYFILNHVLPKDIAAAHMDGDIHIHDMDFYMLTETCCQIDLLSLFKNGFSTGHGYVREPQSIHTYSALACIAIQANQNEMHGGQSIPNFDYSMAKGVSKSFEKEYFRALATYLQIRFGYEENDCKEITNKLKSVAGHSITMADYDPLLSILIDSDLLPGSITAEDRKACHEFSWKQAIHFTRIQTKQAMQALIHNLNTMHSRAGAQVPFSSINYGTDTSPEGQMVIECLLESTMDGLGNGETPIFPVQIFKVKEGINYNPGDPNYHLFKLAIETSAKRLFPNFSFIDSPFNLSYYKEGDPNTEVAYMGCRTRVLGNSYDPDRSITYGRGNLSFTSINLPRLGLEAKENIDTFYRLLDEKIDLVIRQLLHRFKIQCMKKVRNYPFLMAQGIWIDSEKLNIDDTIGEVLKHGTLSVGFIGLAETLVALTGKHHGESPESQKLGREIIEHMRKRMDDASQEYHLNFTLLATPAEGLSGRFVKIDQKKYGKISGVTDRDYYTNSFHVPVYYPIRSFEKIQIEAPYHAYTNAGHISYVELDGDTCRNLPAFESVIRYMKEQGIGYGSINHPVDRDPICGYTGVINDICPRCGRREGEGISLIKLKELQKKYPNVPNYVWDTEEE
ncbi:MAG: anaerobic ribonucleoside triphosphate reductase [Eubacteriales bacterium]|nr:anaerobic ribonucleoside triphosphate reductase [Eubacteriales bacterium]